MLNDDVVNMKLISVLNQYIFPPKLCHYFLLLDFQLSAIKVQSTKRSESIIYFDYLTICKKSTGVTKSTNQSNFSKINRSIRRSSFAEQFALQSITNSGVIDIVSSSSLHFAAIYKQPTAKHSKNFGRT
jgi:hypothetical protein